MPPPVRAASVQDSEDEDFFSPLKRRRGGQAAARAVPPGLLPPSPQTSAAAATVAPASSLDAVASEVDYMAWAPSESPESSSETDVYSLMTGAKGKSSFNPFGSNFVTMDDIVQQQQSYGRTSVDRERSSSVANSDLGLNETEAEREEREEREKKEFMEALRAARRQQDAVFKDSAPSSSSSSIGRVYALDGEAGDEEGATETRKSALELLEEQKKGKELKPVDHSKIEYLPFRKNLYIVPRALAKLSEEDVAAKREDLQIKVRGRGCPAPVDTWDQCGLSERILQQLQNLNLVAPFAIQKQAVPAIMCGRDVIGVAKTGSGKTLAFLLPMFRHVLDQPPLRDLDGPIGLIMAPARELAFQIFSECKKFTKVLGLRCGCIYGGAGVAEQIADIKRGMEIAVCTPGRLIDILCMQAGKLLSLQRVSMVVLDEADRMFDMGFEPQLRMVLQNVRPDRQTVLFSATFPKQIEALAKKVLKLPLEIIVGELAAGSVNKDITQIIEVHEESDKYLRLLQLLGTWYEKGSVLVFVDTQDKCDQLFQDVSPPCLLPSCLPCLAYSSFLLILTPLFSHSHTRFTTVADGGLPLPVPARRQGPGGPGPHPSRVQDGSQDGSHRHLRRRPRSRRPRHCLRRQLQHAQPHRGVCAPRRSHRSRRSQRHSLHLRFVAGGQVLLRLHPGLGASGRRGAERGARASGCLSSQGGSGRGQGRALKLGLCGQGLHLRLGRNERGAARSGDAKEGVREGAGLGRGRR